MRTQMTCPPEEPLATTSKCCWDLSSHLTVLLSGSLLVHLNIQKARMLICNNTAKYATNLANRHDFAIRVPIMHNTLYQSNIVHVHDKGRSTIP